MGTFENFMQSDYGRNKINQVDGSMFDWIADNGTLIVDFVGRFENIQADWEHLCARIGIEGLKLPHSNQTERQDYRQYYSAETRQIVAKRFAKNN